MRPIIVSDQNKTTQIFDNNLTNKQKKTITLAKPVVKSRLFAPKASEKILKQGINTNTTNNNSVRTILKKPAIASTKNKQPEEPSIELTQLQKILNAEEINKTAIENAQTCLLSNGEKLAFSIEKLDEAAEYCDQTETYTELFNFYVEMTDLAEKLTEKKKILENCKEEYLQAMHNYSRFLAKNVLPFQESEAIRLKKIHENIAAAKEAEKKQDELMRNNPMLYKKNVEMKDVAVEVKPESFIYFSPNAGILRSAVKQTMTMPASPVLKTDNPNYTPNSSLYPGQSGRRQPIFQKPTFPLSSLRQSNYDENIMPAIGRYSDVKFNRVVTFYNNNKVKKQNVNSPFSKRLNFDETVQEMENVITRLNKTALEETISMPNQTFLLRPSISKNDTNLTVNSLSTNKLTMALPEDPVLLTDLTNIQK